MPRLLLLLALAACSPPPAPAPPLSSALAAQLRPERPLNIAHRGGSALGPEETLPTFAASLAAGADVLEMDLHLTADGHVVCMHDELVDRTTDGVGPVKGFTLEALRALDAGWAFTADDGLTHPARGQGVRVPTLTEVLRAFPDAPLVIEIKQTEPPMVEPVLAALRAEGAMDRVVVASFDDDTLAAVRAAPDAPATSLGPGEVLSWLLVDTPDEERTWTAPGRFLHVPPEVYGLEVASAERLARAERMGLAMQVWTIREPEQMRALVDRGVHGLMTPDPATLARVLGEAGRR